MPALVDANALPAGKYGYRVYGVMAHLSSGQQAAVLEFHRSIGVTDLATRPHCSIHNFYDPSDINLLRQRLAGAAAKSAPFMTEIDLKEFHTWPSGAAFGVIPHPELMKLHDTVVAALDGIVKLIYTPDSPYSPHTTVLLSGTPEEVERAKKAAPLLKLKPQLEVRSIELIGRIGPNRGGEYRIITSFPLSKTG
jgi:2'-5' RNA ligase